jgi:hypothetical protein
MPFDSEHQDETDSSYSLSHPTDPEQPTDLEQPTETDPSTDEELPIDSEPSLAGRVAVQPLADPPFVIPPEPTLNDRLAAIRLELAPGVVDDDGYASIWNFVAACADDDSLLARNLAGKILCFLCKHDCDFVVTSSTDARYLDDWFERDPALLYDWSPASDRVDVVAQHAQVPGQALVRFLKQHRFDATKVYNPRRSDREKWFREGWCVG